MDLATPLHVASLAANLENTKILLKHNANPNSKDSIGNTPMHFAVAFDNLPIVTLLDEYGADATIKNEEDRCPIEVAVEDDLKEIVLHFMS